MKTNETTFVINVDELATYFGMEEDPYYRTQGDENLIHELWRRRLNEK